MVTLDKALSGIIDLNTDAQREYCQEYSDNYEDLCKLLGTMKITGKFTAYKKHFAEDNKDRLEFTVTYKNPVNRTSLIVPIGMSYVDTEKFLNFGKLSQEDKKELLNGLLYTALTCLGADLIDLDMTLTEFANEFGYDLTDPEEERKIRNMYEDCQSTTELAQDVFGYNIEDLFSEDFDYIRELLPC